MSGIEYRYRIEMRIVPDGEWLNTGLAIKPQSDGAAVVIADVPIPEADHGILHVSESNIFDPRRETPEEFNERQSNRDFDGLRKEVDALRWQVSTLISKTRVAVDCSLARAIRDIDRRGMA